MDACADLRPLLIGVLIDRWVSDAAACTVLDTLVQELGMDLLKPLPGSSEGDPGTPVEIALASPAALKHMVMRLGLDANARLVGSAADGTLLHRAVYLTWMGPAAAIDCLIAIRPRPSGRRRRPKLQRPGRHVPAAVCSRFFPAWASPLGNRSPAPRQHLAAQDDLTAFLRGS